MTEDRTYVIGVYRYRPVALRRQRVLQRALRIISSRWELLPSDVHLMYSLILTASLPDWARCVWLERRDDGRWVLLCGAHRRL